MPDTENTSVEQNRAYLFNRFYFDLLKRAKNEAKKEKTTNRDARNILRAIKSGYSSYETGSAEYLKALAESIPPSFWAAYRACSEDKADEFLSSEEASTAWAYKQISVQMLSSVMKDRFVLHHFLTIFAILLLEGASNDDATHALDIMKNIRMENLEDALDGITSPDVKGWIVRLHAIYTCTVNSSLMDMESTSIGRLAKEIMDEVDLTSIKNTVETEGDIFKALADPNSGIASLLGTVSQKMIGKLASGEIKQENLLEDAMKFATKLPQMLQGAGGSAGGIDLGGMATMMQGMMGGGAPGSLDIGSITQMMQGMMGGAAPRPPTRRATGDARRSAMVERMRNKVAKSKENITEK